MAAPVDHAFFIERYERSKCSSPFNVALYLCAHRPTFVLALFRNLKIEIGRDGTVTRSEVSEDERRRIVVEEAGISEEAAEALPPGTPEREF